MTSQSNHSIFFRYKLYQPHLFIAFAFIGLLFVPIHLNAASNWLSDTEIDQYKITAEELDGMIYAYADSYMTQMVSATRHIISNTQDSQKRSNAMMLRVGSVNSIYDIASNPDPFTKLLDLVLAVTLQSYVWIDEDRAETFFGDDSSVLINAMHQNRKDIWKLAAKAMKPEQLYILDWLIIDWRRQNPDVSYVIFTRFSDISGSRVKSIVSDVQTGSGLLAPVNEAKKAIDETRLLAERSFFYAKRAPQLYSWQAENLTDNLLAKPEIALLLKGLDRSTLAVERVSLIMEKLPQLIREERNFISGELDKRESSLSKLLAEVRLTVKDTEHLIQSVDKLSGSGNTLLQELQTTSGSLNITLNTFDNMMTHHFPQIPEDEKPKEEAKPFDINEYTQILIEVDKAAEELTGLVSTSGEVLTSDQLTYRIEQLNNAAKERVDHATNQTEQMMQTLFVYIALTLLLIFVLFILYRRLNMNSLSKN